MNTRAFLCGLLSVVLAGCQPSKSSLPHDKTIGNQIVEALERYKAEHGSYPKQLTDLVPQYLTAVAPPDYGQKKWDYVAYPDQGTFALFIWGRQPAHDAYVYTSAKKEWEIVEKSF